MIDIYRVEDNWLVRHYWRFSLRDLTLSLAQYRHETRKTSRHKWTPDGEWERIRSGVYGRKYITQDAVPFPDDVKAEAVEFVRARITVAEIGK